MKFDVRAQDLARILKSFNLDSPAQLTDLLQSIQAIIFAAKTEHPKTKEPCFNTAAFAFVVYALVKMSCTMAMEQARQLGQPTPEKVGGQFDMFVRSSMQALSEVAAADSEAFEKAAAESILNNMSKKDKEDLH